MISTVLLTTYIIARTIIFYNYLWLHSFGQEKARLPGLENPIKCASLERHTGYVTII